MRKVQPYLLTALALIASASFLFATPLRADDDDPPGRVARLNYIQGSISFQPSGETDWVQANPNRPLTSGDNLWADRDTRGELHIGSTSLRIGSETGVSFLNLDDRTVQIQLAQGTLAVHVRRLEGGDAFEIDTPNLAFTLDRPGVYRVDVDPDGSSTTITVRDGEGDANGGGNEYHLDSGDQARFTGTDSLTYDGGQAGEYDEFDRWCSFRDAAEDRARSAEYVSRDVTGYEDLDGYGDWQEVPDYGMVWFPTQVAVGWAPYRFGHWVWISPWGWTWIEDEPWGFAPFHYGRWAMFRNRWCWVPGPRVIRPVYAPALVAFVGGPGFGVSLAIGGGAGVAWFPLGPREVYVPPYRTSVRYVQNVNVTNTTVNVVNVTNVYNNVRINRTTNITYVHQNNVAAVTAVSRDTFVNARPVASANVRVNPQQMRAAQVQRSVAIAPVRQSVVGATAAAPVRPPQSVMQRQVVVRQTPAPLRPAIGGPAPRQEARPNVRVAQPPAQPSGGNDARTGPAQRNAPGPQPNVMHQPERTQQPQAAPQRTPAPPQQMGSRQQPQGPRGGAQQPQTVPQRTPVPPQQMDSRQQPQGPRGGAQQQQPQQQPQARPNVRYAPPARANEGSYQPHPFPRPQNAEPPQNARPQERAPERQPQGQPQRGTEQNGKGGQPNDRR